MTFLSLILVFANVYCLRFTFIGWCAYCNKSDLWSFRLSFMLIHIIVPVALISYLKNYLNWCVYCMCFLSQFGLGLIGICFIHSDFLCLISMSAVLYSFTLSNYHAEISEAPLASTYLLMQCFSFSQGWTDFSAFSLAGYTHRDALLHLQTKLCDWLAGGAHWDEDVLFQCGHTGGHEWLGQGHEPGCTDANPYSEEVSESQNFTKTFS